MVGLAPGIGKNKTVEGEFLCALWRVTKGLVVVTRLGATWKAGLATVCQESGYLNLPGGSCGREASVSSPAVPEGLSPGLGSCATVSRGVLYKAGWLLSADMFDLSSWKKKKSKTPHCNVELGKDSRCPTWKKKKPVFIYQVLQNLLEVLVGEDYFFLLSLHLAI